MALTRVRLSELLPPPMATVFENSSADSTEGSPFHLERPLRRVDTRDQSPLCSVPPLLHAPPDRPLPRVPRPDNPYARARPHLELPSPTRPPPAPPAQRRAKPVPNFSRPLPPKPPPRDRDFSDTFTAWTRYVDKTEPLSQSGKLRAYHEDMLTRPPGYNPELKQGCVEATKEWCATLYWRWQRITASASNSRREASGQRPAAALTPRCDTPWANTQQNQQYDFWP